MNPKGRDGGKDGGKSWVPVAGSSGKTAKPASSDKPSTDKDYGAALQALIKGTAVINSDIDPKAMQLLDALAEAGKADAALAHLTKSLEGLSREKIVNWKAYIFVLLRQFDVEIYNAMKDARGRPRPRRSDERHSTLELTALNVAAPEFVPGKPWNGAEEARVEGAAADAAAKEGEGTVFQVECKTDMGETVAVCGSDDLLGAWSSGSAVPLTCDGSYPLWKSAPLKVAKDAEYKFVILGKDGAISRWEPIEGNRKLHEGARPQAVKFGEK